MFKRCPLLFSVKIELLPPQNKPTTLFLWHLFNPFSVVIKYRATINASIRWRVPVRDQCGRFSVHDLTPVIGLLPMFAPKLLAMIEPWAEVWPVRLEKGLQPRRNMELMVPMMAHRIDLVGRSQ